MKYIELFNCLFTQSVTAITWLNSVLCSDNLFTKAFCFSPSSFNINPFSSTFTFLASSALNLNSSISPSVLLSFCPCNFCISGLFSIVVIKHNFIFSSDISFEITNTFFLSTKAVYAAKLIVNLLFPEFDGIAYAIVSPFLIPLNTEFNIGNGSFNPVVRLLSPSFKNSLKSEFSTDDLNLFVIIICSIAFSTSSTDICAYNL